MAKESGQTLAIVGDQEGSARAITYATTKDQIAELAKLYVGLDVRANPKLAREARADLRGRRVAVEARRVELKKEALEYGRKVDSAAKELATAISAIEDPIDEAIKVIEKEEAHAKFLVENAERLERERVEREAREAAEAATRAELAAQEAAIAETARLQGIEQDRLNQESAKLEVARKKEEQRQAAERKKLDEDRRKFEAEKAEAERKIKEEKERTEREAQESALRDLQERAAVERARLRAIPCESCGRSITDGKACGVVHAALQTDDEAVAIAERERAEALRPDREKLAAFAQAIREKVIQFAPVRLVSNEAGEALDRACADIEDIAKRLEAFGS